MNGFESIRVEAANGIEHVDMHPVLAERLPATADSPRRALLDEAGNADIYLLLLGPRYGEPGSGGKSPTEEEYEEAVRKGRPMLVLVQEGELEPEQATFLERIRGNWESGVLYAKFNNENDVALAVAGALVRHERSAVESPERAREQAERLARGEERGYYGTLSARIAMVPLRDTVLLDPVALEDPSLTESLMALSRSSGLVPQAAGIDAKVSGDGVTLASGDGHRGALAEMSVAPDGAIAVSAPVHAEGTLGGSLVDPERLAALIADAAGFARSVWGQIDKQDEVGRVAVAVAIPNAQNSGFGKGDGHSMSMGHGLPSVVIAADAPEGVPRGQIGDKSQVLRFLAAIRRVYLDAGAVQGES